MNPLLSSPSSPFFFPFLLSVPKHEKFAAKKAPRFGFGTEKEVISPTRQP
jgi:hypothetical protein